MKKPITEGKHREISEGMRFGFVIGCSIGLVICLLFFWAADHAEKNRLMNDGFVPCDDEEGTFAGNLSRNSAWKVQFSKNKSEFDCRVLWLGDVPA